jgi:hypothetical protein
MSGHLHPRRTHERMNTPSSGKTETDPVTEVRRVREANAAKFKYDLAAIIADIQSRERQGGQRVVDLHDEAVAKVARGEGRAGRREMLEVRFKM